MTRVDEFNSFYSSTSDAALQATYAVCGDRKVAFDATVDAYRRAWRDWSKIREHHPLGWVRNEAWKLTSLNRSTHPLRRKHEEDADVPLLEALGRLTVDNRRLIVLLTLGQSDLEEASREVGMPAQQGIEAVTGALDQLERELGQPLNEIEDRMHGLGAVTSRFELPPSDVIRHRAQIGRRRNTVLLVATAFALVVGGGFVVTDGDALEMRADMPRREKIGSERPDLVLRAQEIGTDDLLTRQQVQRLDSKEAWQVVDTDDDTTSTTPYATCPTKRFANKDPLRAFVRTFEGRGDTNERVAQAIEVSRGADQAEDAYKRLVGWYSDCAHPRVQLVDSYVATREFGDFRILRLHSHRSPERIFTVGFTHSGSVTIALVHEVDGDRGPDIDDFALTLNDSITQVCQESGGRCTDPVKPKRTDPPPTSEAPQFLGIVDLPPIADIDQVWAGTTTRGRSNPAATQCDSASFRGKSVTWARSRIFVIPAARELPEEFGVAETVGRFRSSDAAKDFVKAIEKRVSDCEDDNLSAKVDQESTITSGDQRGTAWRVGLEVNKKSRVFYRMAVVRRGSDVLQVTFTPAGQYDISEKTFTALAERATQRLVYLN